MSVHRGGESIVAAVKVELTWHLTGKQTEHSMGTRGTYYPQRRAPSDVLLSVPLPKNTTVKKKKTSSNNTNKTKQNKMKLQNNNNNKTQPKTTRKHQ